MSGARSTIVFADDAEVVPGPGSVPLGRWHSPDGHARSGRCGRSGEAARSDQPLVTLLYELLTQRALYRLPLYRDNGPGERRWTAERRTLGIGELFFANGYP